MSRSRSAASPLLAFALSAALAACSPSGAPSGEANATPAAAEAAVPAAPAASEDARPFAIGTLQAVALRDGGITLPNDNKVFGVGRTPEEVAALLTAAGLPGDPLQVSLQPLLVRAGERVLLFDTGAGGSLGEGAGKLGAALAAAGVAPGQVTDIFISHYHGDHTGGLLDPQGGPAFPNATIHIAAAEWEHLRGLDPETARSSLIGDHAALVAAMTPRVATFAPGAELVPGVVKAVSTTGHTPGHAAYLIGSGADTLLYVGDTMHHHVVSVQKPEWPIGFDGDAVAGAASRGALLEQAAGSGQRVYAVHFPFPGLGRIERRGEGYAWAAE
ncbi:MAG TPA: MBL fold metallo-hydrolase [Pseudoxanthomonas sp.]|nr:MBL fold metallo-hydrolase [Pseudoxanthomonas sp.]